MRQGFGRIINVGSQLALAGAGSLAHYCAAKGGVHAFTRALALEVAPHGITANTIAPGPVATDLLAGAPAESFEQLRQAIPLKRFGRIEEIAATAVLLASDDGAYYTGSTLNISGGHVMV